MRKKKRSRPLRGNQYNLEYRQGESNKFWLIQLDDWHHEIQYGPIGSLGRRKVTEFSCHEDTKRDFQKLVQNKLDKGYVKTGRRVKDWWERQTGRALWVFCGEFVGLALQPVFHHNDAFHSPTAPPTNW